VSPPQKPILHPDVKHLHSFGILEIWPIQIISNTEALVGQEKNFIQGKVGSLEFYGHKFKTENFRGTKMEID